jgi:hypothetical protein
MSTAESDREDARARRDFLLGAIHHGQAVIGSLENRVPMALVLHGLLFTGLLQITLHVEGIVRHHEGWRIVTVILLALVLLSFLVSVLALVTSITPPLSATPGISYAPPARPDDAAPELFFPTITSGRLSPWLSSRHRELTVDTVEENLSVNLLLLATFRTYKTGLARIGFWWLRVEVVLAVMYVTTVSVAALVV